MALDIDEDTLIAAGWLPPQRVAELETTIQALIEGRLLSVPKATDPLSQGLRSLAGTLGRQSSGDLRTLVKAAMAISQSGFHAAEALRDASDSSDRSRTIASATEQLVASIETISMNTNQVAEETRNARQEAQEGERAATNAVGAMETIAQVFEDAITRVHALAAASEEINSILEVINEIAFHTNILALNASVEAARAGDAGRGFAVVAEEVRRLADQTKSATVQIGGRISRLRGEMSAIVGSMNHAGEAVQNGRSAISATGDRVRSIAGNVDGVTNSVNEIAHILDQQKEAVMEVAQAIDQLAVMNEKMVVRMTDSVDQMEEADKFVAQRLDALSKMELPNIAVHRAKADHVAWKKRLAFMLINRVSLKSEELTDHHQCRLGKWYDNVSDPEQTGKACFAGIAHPHATLHTHGKKAADLFNAGDVAGAIRELSVVDEQSLEVLRCLDELAPIPAS